MKIYILQTFVTDDEGNFTITFHRKLFIDLEWAFIEAKKLGKDTSVLEFTQTNSWEPGLIALDSPLDEA